MWVVLGTDDFFTTKTQSFGGFSVAKYVCTKEQFEASKAESESTANWYDYEDKAALFFLGAGDKVQFTHGLACWIDGEVVAMNSRGGCVIEYGIDTYATIYKEESIRPMDWDKNKVDCTDLLAVVSDAIHKNQGNENTIGAIVHAILAAGYRKCDNKTPSTKE